MSNLIKLDIVQAEQLYQAGYTIFRGRGKNAPQLRKDRERKTWETLKREGWIINQPKCSPFYVHLGDVVNVRERIDRLNEYEYKG